MPDRAHEELLAQFRLAAEDVHRQLGRNCMTWHIDFMRAWFALHREECQ